MLILPNEIMTLLTPFKQLFSRRIWDWVEVLVVGALLAPGKRTVSAVLEVMGLKGERQFQNYHRALNRAKWSGLAVSRVLLGLLVGGVRAGGRDGDGWGVASQTGFTPNLNAPPLDISLELMYYGNYWYKKPSAEA